MHRPDRSHARRPLPRRIWLLGFTLLLVAPHAAEAKECVWNSGAYIARVEWYAPQDLVLAAVETEGTTYLAPGFEDTDSRSKTRKLAVADGRISIPGSLKRTGRNLDDVTLRLARRGEPVQVDQFPAGAGRCIGRPGGPYTAVVGAVGRAGLANFTRGFVGGLWLAGAAIAHTLCAESYRCATDWVATVEVIRDETAKIHEGVEDVFYVGVPEPTRWLEVSGPVLGATASPGREISAEQQSMTGCHLWTDDFDAWCSQEFAPGWGMKEKVGGGCMTGQGKAICAAGYAGGTEIAADTKLTGCHLWTDDFGWWCRHEFGPAYSFRSKDGHGCMIGQGKVRTLEAVFGSPRLGPSRRMARAERRGAPSHESAPRAGPRDLLGAEAALRQHEGRALVHPSAAHGEDRPTVREAAGIEAASKRRTPPPNSRKPDS